MARAPEFRAAAIEDVRQKALRLPVELREVGLDQRLNDALSRAAVIFQESVILRMALATGIYPLYHPKKLVRALLHALC